MFHRKKLSVLWFCWFIIKIDTTFQNIDSTSEKKTLINTIKTRPSEAVWPVHSRFKFHLYCTFSILYIFDSSVDNHSNSKNNLHFSYYIFINKETVGSFYLLHSPLVHSLRFKNPHNHNSFCATELMVWLTLEHSLEEPSKFHMKKEEQFILIMCTYP